MTRPTQEPSAHEPWGVEDMILEEKQRILYIHTPLTFRFTQEGRPRGNVALMPARSAPVDVATRNDFFVSFFMRAKPVAKEEEVIGIKHMDRT